ncbi:hypothetical protein NicSoilB4_31760 [Arthrobacter sp. NicSoilB4]|nr:hypothetical protein NicSoilB4_31760 [Arthrobacter sp. NicSoilB4]
MSIHFHAVVRSLQMYHGAAFSEGKGQTVNCAGQPKSMEINRVCIGEDATDGDDIIAE